MTEKVNFNEKTPKVCGVKRAAVALLDKNTTEELSHQAVDVFTRCRKVAIAPVYADQELNTNDSVEIGGSEIVGYTVTIDASGIRQETEAKIYGHKIDDGGNMVEEDGDQAPELALLLELSMTEKNSKFVVLYCGSAKHPSEEAESRTKSSYTLGLPSIEFSFYKAMNGLLKMSTRTDAAGYTPEIGNTWFDEVKYPVKAPASEG